jgi:hypothetical protein
MGSCMAWGRFCSGTGASHSSSAVLPRFVVVFPTWLVVLIWALLYDSVPIRWAGFAGRRGCACCLGLRYLGLRAMGEES